MARSIIDVDGAALLSTVTSKVTMPTRLKARRWAGAWLFRIGAWVAGMGVTIDIQTPERCSSTTPQ